MNKLKTIIATLLLTAATTATAQIGTWRIYTAYSQVENILKASGNTVYVQASGGLYSYNTTDHSITTYDKTTVLNGSNITHMAWCQATQKLVIVYENGNIDLLDNKTGETENIPDYYNKSMTEDKTVYGIDVYDTHAYLSTGFGIVNINTANASITDTYKIGFRIDWCSIEGSTIYAHSSTNGTYSASVSANLLDPSVWTYSSAYTAKQNSIDQELQAEVNALSPGGPKYNYFGYMKFSNNRLYTTGGGWGSGSEYFRPGCVQILENNEWNVYDDSFTLPNNANYLDNCGLAIDPQDKDHVYVTNVHCGLLEFRNGQLVANYTEGNSELYSTLRGNDGTPNYNYVRVDGPVFDQNGNLFMLNSTAKNSIVELSTDGTWSAHNFDCLLYEGLTDRSLGIMRRSILDSRGLIWFINDHYIHPSLFCYDPTTDNIVDFNTLYNQDGTLLTTIGMTCVAEDMDNNIWVGTDIGPLVLSESQMADNSLGYTQVKVPRNDGTNLADYLLNNIGISDIVIDGANRKWFGTSGNGVYLISADNMTQVQHFTSSNSPLLSDNIESLAYDGEKAVLYIGTDKGLCSYQSDATTPSTDMTKDNVYAYPNPVRPDHTGPITIVGLTYNASVKITSTNGVLVAEGRSNGGSFTWDGCDRKGRRVASGIYIVQTATQYGEKGTVCKIAVVY